MAKDMNLQSLFCGILFCISIAALIIACLAFTKKNQGGEYYQGCGSRGGGGVKSFLAAADDLEKKRKKRLLQRQ